MEYNSDRRFGLDDSAQNINILSFKIYNEMMWNRRRATPFLVIQTVRFSRYFDSIRFLFVFFYFVFVDFSFDTASIRYGELKSPPKKLLMVFSSFTASQHNLRCRSIGQPGSPTDTQT